MDYVSKWVEAITCPRNDASTVVGFIQRNILSRFGVPRTIISDEGSHSNKVILELIRDGKCVCIRGFPTRSDPVKQYKNPLTG